MTVSAELYQRLADGDEGVIGDLFRYPEDVMYGRLNPLVRPYFLFVYFAIGRNFWVWGIWNAAILALSVQMVYSLAQRLSSHTLAPFLSSLLYLCFGRVWIVVGAHHLLETPSTLLACAAFLSLHSSLTGAQRGAKVDVVGWVWTAAVIICSAALLGLKETNAAFLASFMIVIVAAIFAGPPHVRLRAICLFFVISALLAWLLVWLYFAHQSQGGYTKFYNPSRWPIALERLEANRRYILGAYGPLPVFAAVSLVVRIFLGISLGGLWKGLAWRLAMFSAPIMMILGVSPFEVHGYSAPYYLNSVVPFLALFIVWELSDVWQLASRRVSGAGSPDAASLDWWLRRLTVAILVTWSLPVVFNGARDSIVLAKLLALGTTFALGLVVVTYGKKVFESEGSLGAGFRANVKFWTVFCVLHLVAFPVPTIFSVVNRIRVAQQTQLAALHWVAENAPTNANVLVDNYWSEWARLEIGLHLDSCEDRPDVRVGRPRQFGDVTDDPSGAYIVLWELPQDSNRTQPDVEGLRARRFSGRVCLYHFRLGQPAYLSARLLGRHYGSPPELSPIVDRVEYAATVYYR